MNIPIGKYVITSDSCNFILSEKKIKEKGKDEGEEYLSNIGFYSTLEGLVQDFVTINIRNSFATSLKELMAEVAEIRKMIKEALKGI